LGDCILNFTKIRWKITELLGSKVLAETPCINTAYVLTYFPRTIYNLGCSFVWSSATGFSFNTSIFLQLATRCHQIGRLVRRENLLEIQKTKLNLRKDVQALVQNQL
jgi:hypothetical protein